MPRISQRRDGKLKSKQQLDGIIMMGVYFELRPVADSQPDESGKKMKKKKKRKTLTVEAS
eukprot:UN15135